MDFIFTVEELNGLFLSEKKLKDRERRNRNEKKRQNAIKDIESKIKKMVSILDNDLNVATRLDVLNSAWVLLTRQVQIHCDRRDQ